MLHRKRNRRLKRRQKSRPRKDLSGPSRQRCVVDFDSRSCRRRAPEKSRLTFMVKGGLDLASESFAERDAARHNILNKRLTLFLTDNYHTKNRCCRSIIDWRG